MGADEGTAKQLGTLLFRNFQGTVLSAKQTTFLQTHVSSAEAASFQTQLQFLCMYLAFITGRRYFTRDQCDELVAAFLAPYERWQAKVGDVVPAAPHVRDLFDRYEQSRRWAGIDRENPAGLGRGVCDHVLGTTEPTLPQMTAAVEWVDWYVSGIEPFFARFRMIE